MNTLKIKKANIIDAGPIDPELVGDLVETMNGMIDGSHEQGDFPLNDELQCIVDLLKTNQATINYTMKG